MDIENIIIPEVDINTYSMLIYDFKKDKVRSVFKNASDQSLFDIASLTKTIGQTAFRNMFGDVISKLPIKESYLAGYQVEFSNGNSFRNNENDNKLPVPIFEIIKVPYVATDHVLYSNLCPAWIYAYCNEKLGIQFRDDILQPMLNRLNMNQTILYEGNPILRAIPTGEKSRNGHVHDPMTYDQLKYHKIQTGCAGLFSNGVDMLKFAIWVKNNNVFSTYTNTSRMWWSFWKLRETYPVAGWYFSGHTGCRLIIADDYILVFLSDAVKNSTKESIFGFCLNIFNQVVQLK